LVLFFTLLVPFYAGTLDFHGQFVAIMRDLFLLWKLQVLGLWIPLGAIVVGWDPQVRS
jgi:predicted solute-binding protein